MSLTLIIIIATVAISFYTWSKPGLHYKFMMNPYQMATRNEYWRLLTSGFIHSNYTHLGFNMFTLFFFGGVVEQLFAMEKGPSASLFFLVFYLSAIVISDLPVAWKNRHNPGYNSLGASGAVSAMVFCSILYMPLNKIYLFGIVGIPGFILGAFYIVYSYSQGKKMSDNINHEAHLYGALYGILFGLLVSPQSGPDFFDQILHYRIF
ncbi:MAG: rhomboid family intramembrane serine protease [Cyclobacteriaceae bacterium]|nr:rhomboid family intramembrane serine protease [Cyclobacteriaceae bacterium]